MSIITLTTDLGDRDYYAGALRGYILSNCRVGHIVDISNRITNFDVFHAGIVLRNAYTFFPDGTVHLAYVDTEMIEFRRFLAIEYRKHFFLGPDNGLFSMVLDGSPERIVELDQSGQPETPFPARDVLAHFACRLVNGEDISSFGKAADRFEALRSLQPIVMDDSIRAHVIYVDQYENAMINVDVETFEQQRKGRNFVIIFKRTEFIHRIDRNYNDVPAGEKLCFFNSAGYLEIAINKGKASSLLGLRLNDPVQIEFE